MTDLDTQIKVQAEISGKERIVAKRSRRWLSFEIKGSWLDARGGYESKKFSANRNFGKTFAVGFIGYALIVSAHAAVFYGISFYKPSMPDLVRLPQIPKSSIEVEIVPNLPMPARKESHGHLEQSDKVLVKGPDGSLIEIECRFFPQRGSAECKPIAGSTIQ